MSVPINIYLRWDYCIWRLIISGILSAFITPLILFTPSLLGFSPVISWFAIFGSIFALPTAIFMHSKNYTQYWQWVLAGVITLTFFYILIYFRKYSFKEIFDFTLLILACYSATAGLIYCYFLRRDINKITVKQTPSTSLRGEAEAI